MPRDDYKNCRNCGGPSAEVGPLSHNRFCRPCAERLEAEAILQQVNHSGPVFQHWRRRIAASVGAVCKDDLERAV